MITLKIGDKFTALGGKAICTILQILDDNDIVIEHKQGFYKQRKTWPADHVKYCLENGTNGLGNYLPFGKVPFTDDEITKIYYEDEVQVILQSFIKAINRTDLELFTKNWWDKNK